MVRRGLKVPPRKEILQRYQSDPVAFAREVLACEPWSVQEAIMRSVATNKRTTVRSCHNSGKSWCAATLVHWFLRTYNPSLVITTAPTDRQVRQVLWKEIRQQHTTARLTGVLNQQDLTVSSTQRAFGFTTSEAEKFQGWHERNILVIVDEASGVEEPIYEAIEGILTGPNAKLLLIGNPNNSVGTFYDSFTSPLYQSFHIRAADVPETLLPPGWAAERLAWWGAESPIYKVRVLGDFPPQGDDALFNVDWVTAAQERELEPGRDEIVIGSDIARYGADESVAYVRRGGSVLAAEYWRGQDTVASAARIARLARDYRAARIQVDDIGVGGGVTDQLVRIFAGTGTAVIGINVGEAARDSENYYNLRTEIFAGLAERFKAGDISIPADDADLASQLVSLRKQFTPRGQMKLESKDDLRKRRPSGARWQSPDRADALSLAFASCGNRFMPVSSVGKGRPM